MKELMLIITLFVGLPIAVTYLLMRSMKDTAIFLRSFEIAGVVNVFYFLTRTKKKVDSSDMGYNKDKLLESISDVESYITALKVSVPDKLLRKIIFWDFKYFWSQLLKSWLKKFAYLKDKWR